MNNILEKLGQVMNQMTQEGYALIMLSILVIFFLLYYLFTCARKKETEKNP